MVCFLPGLYVLRHDAPRQIVVAVVAPRVVKEISSRGEDVTRKTGAALQRDRDQTTGWFNKRFYHLIEHFLFLKAHPVQIGLPHPEEVNDQRGGQQLPDEQNHPEDDVTGIAESRL